MNGLTSFSIRREMEIDIEEIIDRFDAIKKLVIDLTQFFLHIST